MKKRELRLQTILDILTNHCVGSQDELSKLLAVQGHIVTQATLSRDLKMLRTTKVANDLGGYRYITTKPSEEHIIDDDIYIPCTSQTSNHHAALSLAFSGNIAVIKTRNGYASGLAYDIDMLKSSHIVGTISGADTVLAVINEFTSRNELLNLLQGFLPDEVIATARLQLEP